MLINDLDGQTLSVTPQNNNWYPIEKDVYNVQLVQTQSAFNQFGGTRWGVDTSTSNQIVNLQVDGPFYFTTSAQVINRVRVGSQSTDWSFGGTREWQWFRGPDLRNASFIDLTVAPNGFLVGLTSDKRIVYSGVNQIWKELAPVVTAMNAKVTNVSLGLPSMLYALLDDGTIYRLADYNTSAIWTAIPSVSGGASYISCGVDNNLWAISKTGKVLTLDGTSASLAWVDVTSTSPANLVSVSAGTSNSVWAVDNAGKVWRRTSSSSTISGWVDGGASNLRSVQVGVDGSVFGVTTQQGIVRYNGTNLNTWQALPGHVKSLAVASSNLVIGTSYIEGIFRYRPVTSTPSLTTRFHTLSAGSDIRPLDSAVNVNFNATIDEFILCGGMANIVYSTDVDVTTYLTNVSYIVKVIINDAATHTQAFVAWNSYNKTLVVAFRGTDSTQDVVNDLQQTESSSLTLLGAGPLQGLVPQGFATAYGAVRSQVWTAVQNVVDSVTISQIKKIYVTGHSLGGALAAYGAADLAVLLKAKYSFTDSNVLKMINFGAPYSANDAFYDFFTNGLASSVTGVAVINERDIVPYLSVPLYAWRRLGAQYILHDPNYPLLVDTLYSHQMATYNTLLSSPFNAFTAIKSIEVQITTGSNAFGWFDKAGTDRAVSIVFGAVNKTGYSVTLPLTGSSKTFKLENVLVDPLTDAGVPSSGVSLLTFENDKTDTFNLDKAYLLDVRDVNGFVLCIDNSTSFTQNAAAFLNFGIRDNWLVTAIKIKIDGAVRYNKGTSVYLGPDFNAAYADNLLPIP